MPSVQESQPARGNHVLSLLSEAAYFTLAPKLQTVQLEVKQMLHERDKPFSGVYFPTTSVASALLPLLDGAAVEVGTVGNEGFSAVEMLAGAESPINDFICQVPGEAKRMSVADFQQALESVPELRKLAFGFLQCYMAQMAQSAACNGQHAVEARFARWLLITHDRVSGDDFYLTQEFLSQMLGVHRPSVSLIANQFQKAGLIRYSRGHVMVTDRAGIEDVCCECYGDVRRRFQHVMGIARG